jgi:carbonic anhydrase
MSNWSYKNYPKWSKLYPTCSTNKFPKQSPINIVPKDIRQECGTKCQIIIKYAPSKCYLINDHNTIIINYEPGSFIIYQNTWYELTKAKIHVPSLHTFNGNHYSAEINLYHCVDNQCDSGLILAIPLNRGPDYGESVDFINQFINQAPLNNTLVEREVTVSPTWNIISLLPEDRTCYIYQGSLPHPPCTEGWTWIVFNQPSKIGMTALKTLQNNIVKRAGENIRPPVPLSDTLGIYKISHDWVTVYEERPIEDQTIQQVDTSNVSVITPSPNSIAIDKTTMFEQYFNDYRDKIRNLMLFILVVLIIALSIKMAKYIIRNDVVNKFLVPENLGMMPGPNNYENNGSMPPNSEMNMNMPPNNTNMSNGNKPPNPYNNPVLSTENTVEQPPSNTGNQQPKNKNNGPKPPNNQGNRKNQGNQVQSNQGQGNQGQGNQGQGNQGQGNKGKDN